MVCVVVLDRSTSMITRLFCLELARGVEKEGYCARTVLTLHFMHLRIQEARKARIQEADAAVGGFEINLCSSTCQRWSGLTGITGDGTLGIWMGLRPCEAHMD